MPAASKCLTLLQVDDDPVFNSICSQHFQENESVQLVQATTVKAAERHLKQDPGIDALMLDLSLPDRDGIEFLQTLKDLSFSGKLIIVSSQVADVIKMAGTLATTKGLNMVAKIEKPLTPEKLELLDAAISPDVTP